VEEGKGKKMIIGRQRSEMNIEDGSVITIGRLEDWRLKKKTEG
jgi:hypothetical protein